MRLTDLQTVFINTRVAEMTQQIQQQQIIVAQEEQAKALRDEVDLKQEHIQESQESEAALIKDEHERGQKDQARPGKKSPDEKSEGESEEKKPVSDGIHGTNIDITV